jgi:hypothetical protein
MGIGLVNAFMASGKPWAITGDFGVAIHSSYSGLSKLKIPKEFHIAIKSSNLENFEKMLQKEQYAWNQTKSRRGKFARFERRDGLLPVTLHLQPNSPKVVKYNNHPISPLSDISKLKISNNKRIQKIQESRGAIEKFVRKLNLTVN